MSGAGNRQELRDRLVLAALPHIPFDGWSRRALREAAHDCSLDQTMEERLFPGGPVAAVEHFVDLADRRLGEEAGRADLAAMRLGDRITWLVRHRLEAWTDHREAIRRAVTLLSLPTNAPVALRTAWRTTDAIWYAAGDASADFSYYTKRATLAAVYTSTLLYWLEDNSEGFADTWDFLHRRLEDVTRLPKVKAEARRRLGRLPNPLQMLIERVPATRHFGVHRP